MYQGQPNASSATGTRNRVPDPSPSSGICSVCLDGCPGTCEVARSSYRGREVLYPGPFGKVTAGATKRVPVDYSHLSIQGRCTGATGMEADPDRAIFPAVSTETSIGRDYRIRLSIPVFTGALGSTDIARNNWDGIAAGAAISGIMIVIGENVAGMDPEAVFKDGRLVRSPELERRVRAFRQWYDGYGEVVLQQNVEDMRMGSAEYAIEGLGLSCVEIKWGQGAKDIGGEVKVRDLDKALELKRRGYIVLPDPEDEGVQRAFKEGHFEEFERHSRLGMVDYEGFLRTVERYRRQGARFISLKTGAYRASDLARALRFASDAGIDLVTIDGSGGGTGMSPWRMMNEWGIPTIYLQSMAWGFARTLEEKGRYVPHLAIAGGFSLEDHIFKALALGSPYFKAVCMGRALMIPAFIGKNIKEWIEGGKLPKDMGRYGQTPEAIFVTYETLRSRFGRDVERLPWGAIALYTFCDRLRVGLQQFMAGARKFSIEYIGRDDIVALTKEASEVTGIPYVMEADMEEAEKVLFGNPDRL